MRPKIATRKIRLRVTTVTNAKLEGHVHVPAEVDAAMRLSDIIRTRKDSLLLLTDVADARPVMINIDNVVCIELLD